MKVLITGGLGRIGKFVTSELEQAGHNTVIFDLKNQEKDQCTFIEGDLRDSHAINEAAKNVEAIIHLAAIPHDIPGEPQELMDTNVMGTFNVLEAAASNDVGKILFASSISVYGFLFWKKPPAVQYLPIDEKHPCRPDNMYGLSKLVGEELCYMYTQRHRIQIISLRLATVWFPDDAVTQYLLSSAQQPESDVDLPLRDVKWAYVDVRDVAQAFRLALEDTKATHEVYNIGASDVCSELDSLELVKLYFPEATSILNKDEFLAEKNKALFDISKAKKELGYKPRYNWRIHLGSV